MKKAQNKNPKDNLMTHIGKKKYKKQPDPKTDVWERKDYINNGVIGAKHMIKTKGEKEEVNLEQGARKIKIKVVEQEVTKEQISTLRVTN